ncbi:MAG: hypothetical protein IKS37_07560 [Solobacterium sp.]|nr:hypothetical protein [Solobacterium sp.]
MSELYKKSWVSGWTIVYLSSVLLAFYYYSPLKEYTSPERWMIGAYYVRIYLNSAFLLQSIHRISLYKRMYIPICVRFRRHTAEKKLLLIGIYNCCVYILTAILPMILFFHSHVQSIGLLAAYTALNICLLLIYERLFLEIIAGRLKNLYMVLPFIINFLVSTYLEDFFQLFIR